VQGELYGAIFEAVVGAAEWQRSREEAGGGVDMDDLRSSSRQPPIPRGPRLRGVREHLERVQLLFDLARAHSDENARYRLMLAAIYSCRGMTELMLEAAEKQEAKGLSRGALEDKISPMVPYYTLIEYIRIHDFHRFGIAPPDPSLTQVMVGGPMKLMARKGSAAVVVAEGQLLVKTTGGSQVRLQRPLLCRDGEYFDAQSSKYVKLEEILSAFVARAPAVVSQFEKLLF